MTDLQFALPEYITSSYIKRIRSLLGMSQKDFAKLVCVSKPTIERWEASSEKITGPIILALYLLENNPNYKERLLMPEKIGIRLYYMYKESICTIIDVNEPRQEVRIKNYTNKIMFKAFGVNENPTYDDYLEFIESRCFPKTRDKMKLVLEELGLPFYDPFLIIQKTEGKMAEDDFWLRIEV